jgi:hypothetical protein
MEGPLLLMWVGGVATALSGAALALAFHATWDAGSESAFAQGAAVLALAPPPAAGAILAIGGLVHRRGAEVRSGALPSAYPSAAPAPRELPRFGPCSTSSMPR